MSLQTHALGPTDAHAASHDEEPHVLPIKVYLGIWGILVVLTALTVTVSRFDFGAMNVVVALVVATIKASLVALYFMHLRYDHKFNLIVLLSGLLFLMIFIIPTLTDVTTRGVIDPIRNTGPAPTGYVQKQPPPPGAHPHGE